MNHLPNSQFLPRQSFGVTWPQKFLQGIEPSRLSISATIMTPRFSPLKNRVKSFRAGERSLLSHGYAPGTRLTGMLLRYSLRMLQPGLLSRSPEPRNSASSSAPYVGTHWCSNCSWESNVWSGNMLETGA